MEDIKEIILNDVPCVLFLEKKKAEMPDGYPHRYELRHGDDWGEPVTIEKYVVVNFFGVVFSREPIASKTMFQEQPPVMEVENFLFL